MDVTLLCCITVDWLELVDGASIGFASGESKSLNIFFHLKRVNVRVFQSLHFPFNEFFSNAMIWLHCDHQFGQSQQHVSLLLNVSNNRRSSSHICLASVWTLEQSNWSSMSRKLVCRASKPLKSVALPDSTNEPYGGTLGARIDSVSKRD